MHTRPEGETAAIVLGYLGYKESIEALRHFKREEKRRLKEALEELANDSDENEETDKPNSFWQSKPDYVRCGAYGISLALLGEIEQLRMWHFLPAEDRALKLARKPNKDCGPLFPPEQEYLLAATVAVCRNRGR